MRRVLLLYVQVWYIHPFASVQDIKVARNKCMRVTVTLKVPKNAQS